MSEKPTGPVRKLFQEVMTGAGRQGWMIGHIDCAARSLETVLNDARESLARNPRHKLTHEVAETLKKVVNTLDGLSERLEKVASGEGD